MRGQVLVLARPALGVRVAAGWGIRFLSGGCDRGESMASLESLFARTRFRVWSMRTRAMIESVETPTDIPRVHAGGPNPDRILLFGSDIIVGRGVLSHEVAFPGFLARSIAQKTRRGVDVIVEAHSWFTMEDAVAAARLLELDRYDAVVVDLGLADAMAGTTPAEWAANLEVLLHILSSQVPTSARVFFIESPDPTIVPVFRSPQGRAVARAFQRFNEKSLEVISGFKNVSFVSFPVQQEAATDRLHTARTFEGFAVTLAPSLVAHLEAEFMAGSPRSEPVPSEVRRQASLDRLGILDTAPEPRFDRIVAQAQRVFATGYAMFNLIDHDRRWSKSHLGPHGPVGVRANEFCNTAIHSHGALIVGNAFDDPRFCDNPYVAGGPHVRFYAGYPIEAPDGQRVGALCVYDTQPRQLHGQEETLLRELATKIERELWPTPTTTEPHPQLVP